MSPRAAAPVAIIPARYASTRFPGKPLAVVAGAPMIQQVWQRCIESGAFSRVIVATDDEQIASVASSFGEVIATPSTCSSGMDRVAAAAKLLPQASSIVNVQGDEPALHPDSLRQLVEILDHPDVEMGTLVRPLDGSELGNPNVVKAVLAVNADALYFSRSEIPYPGSESGATWYAHLGVYGYRRDVLLRLASLPPSPLEQREGLEQLRALEHGIRIRCAITSHRSVGVDTPEDIPRAEQAIRTLSDLLAPQRN
jgi:3-deoxy-manno-octulosonate cytidylyltransferase (CMP-KDO synthetase)